MFKGIGNLASMLKNAQQMSGKMGEMNEELKSKEIVAEAGGGMVQVKANGLGEVSKVSIDPQTFEAGDRELIEDLLANAFNQVAVKQKQLQMESLQGLTGGMNIPGLDDALKNMTGGGSSDS